MSSQQSGTRRRLSPLDWLRVSWAFLKRDLLNQSSYRFGFALELSSVFFSAATLFFLSRLVPAEGTGQYLAAYGGDYFGFVLVGVALTGYSGAALSAYSSGIREAQVLGGLEAMVSCEAGPLAVAVGSAVHPYAWVSLRVLAYLVVGSLLFGANVGSADLVSTFIMLALTVLAHSSIGIAAAGMVIVFKKGDPFTCFIGPASQLLGGVYYPLSVMPAPCRIIAQALPLTHSLEGIRRAVLMGEPVSALWQPILALGAFSVVTLPVALFSFRACVRRARQSGTLAAY